MSGVAFSLGKPLFSCLSLIFSCAGGSLRRVSEARVVCFSGCRISRVVSNRYVRGVSDMTACLGSSSRIVRYDSSSEASSDLIIILR